MTFGWVKPLLNLLKPKKLRSVPVGSEQFHRVSADFPKARLTHPPCGSKTLYEISKSAFLKHADRPCMGTREFLGMKSVKPPVKHFGEVNWKTYEQVGYEVEKFGAALRKVGLVPAPHKATLDKMTTPCSLVSFSFVKHETNPLYTTRVVFTHCFYY